jgi:hypothetical protein
MRATVRFGKIEVLNLNLREPSLNFMWGAMGSDGLSKMKGHYHSDNVCSHRLACMAE